MSELIYNIYAHSLINPGDVGQVKADFSVVIVALGILSEEEFTLWRDLCDISPNLPPERFIKSLERAHMRVGKTYMEFASA